MNTTANKITIFRILLIPIFLILMYFELKYWALAVYTIACLSDVADGYIARHYNQITNFGKFIDPLADKMLVLSAMCFFIENEQMYGWAVAIVLLREFAVSGLRLVAVEQGRVIAAAKSGKLKTGVTMISLGCMIVFPLWMTSNASHVLDIIFTCLILITTVYSGIEYFVKNSEVFKEN
jgi:CDP-diacylglycerol--glycerol-3-phosphate 3-phosphatidyltransferase